MNAMRLDSELKQRDDSEGYIAGHCSGGPSLSDKHRGVAVHGVQPICFSATRPQTCRPKAIAIRAAPKAQTAAQPESCQARLAPAEPTAPPTNIPPMKI